MCNFLKSKCCVFTTVKQIKLRFYIQTNKNIHNIYKSMYINIQTHTNNTNKYSKSLKFIEVVNEGGGWRGKGNESPWYIRKSHFFSLWKNT